MMTYCYGRLLPDIYLQALKLICTQDENQFLSLVTYRGNIEDELAGYSRPHTAIATVVRGGEHHHIGASCFLVDEAVGAGAVRRPAERGCY